MTDAHDDVEPRDRALLDAIAEAVGSTEVPAGLIERSEALLTWMTVDAELAELLDDSVGTPAGVRGSVTAEAITFALHGGDWLLEVTIADGVLQGTVSGGRPSEVAVRTSTGEHRTVPVTDGTFELEDTPSGSIRLEFVGPDARRVHTDWFVV